METLEKLYWIGKICMSIYFIDEARHCLWFHPVRLNLCACEKTFCVELHSQKYGLDFVGQHVLLLLHKTSLAVKRETFVSDDSLMMTKTHVARRLSGRPRNCPTMLRLPAPQHLPETFSAHRRAAESVAFATP